jgi:tetratricopeptide (TPR) repeat protein
MLSKHISNLLIVIGLVSIVVLPSCSTRKSTFFTRTYHHTTTKYNWYFNGNESFKAGVKKLEKSKKEDFNQILPIFILPSQNEVQSVSSSMDRAIKKGASAIAKHSILIKGTEHNKTIDETYLLIGNAYLYKLDYLKAIEAFSFTAKQFEGLTTAYQASIGLARAYVLNKDLASAELVLDQLISDEDFPMSLNKDLSLAYADYHYQKGDLNLCIEELKAALLESNKKKEKIRYSYILAQLYYELENYSESSKYFKSVIKKGASYDFEFNAKINLARSYDVAQGNNQEIESELNKMIKDKKNKEYLDVIYFGLAELKARQNQSKQAIAFYQLSVAKSVDNDAQKALSSLILGELFYEDQLYRPAQSYYDTAVAYMSNELPKFKSVQKRQSTLSLLVENLNVISDQDSLQRIAAMSESQRNNFIDGLISKLKEQERLDKQQAQLAKNESAFLNGNQPNRANSRLNQSRGGVWYFYNPTTLSFGFSEFGRKWGKRKLEDNWRRSNKKSFGIDEIETVEDLEDEFDPTSRDSYIAKLPLSVDQIKLSNQKIIEAYYSAAIIYKEDLGDLALSLKTFEELNQRFPKNDNQVKVLYFLYRLNLSQQNQEEAAKHKEMLLKLFPQSDYAKIISDSSYLETLQNAKPTIDVLYEKAYNKYLSGQYQAAISDCQSANKNHKGNILTPRFDLLHALASGHVQGKDKMIVLLQKVVETHQGHEVADSAQEILDQFKEQEPSQSNEPVEAKSNNTYSYEPNTTHYFILIFKEFDLEQNIAKATLSDYHSQFYSLEKLNISALLLDKETNMISVREFDNAKTAMNYFNAFQAGDARGPFGDNYQSFVISQSNFPIFYKSKKVDEYLIKFKEFYQSQQ